MKILDGIIIKGVGGFYYVKAADGVIYECKARGSLRRERITPAIGDRVEILLDGEKGAITKIYKRKNRLIRPSVANIDTLMLVVAAASPEPNLFLADKMLINAQINGIEPAVCINKTDLADRGDIKEIYQSIGFKVFCACAEKNEGIGELKSFLKGRVTAFAGLSGVGKSSLLRLVTNNELETGEVSEKIQRGKHTTRHVELFPLEGGGFVLDTPGFSSLEIDGIKAEELQEYFPEMADVKNNCRFKGCAHISEPDCAVKKLLETGGIAQSRYDSYKELYEILKQIKEWEK